MADSTLLCGATAGYNIESNSVRNLIKEGYRPDEIIRLYRGQGTDHTEVISPAARIGGRELSEQKLQEPHSHIPMPLNGDIFEQRLLVHKSNSFNGTKDDVFVSMTTDYEVARNYALLNATENSSPVVLEVLIPKFEVHRIRGNNEYEFAIPHELPQKYIQNKFFVNSKTKTFSPELEAAVKIFDQYAPRFAYLLRDGIIPIQLDLPMEKGMPSGGSMGKDGLRIFPDSEHPFSTAITLYEEVAHAFQGAQKGIDAEMQAKKYAYDWARKVQQARRESGQSEFTYRGGVFDIERDWYWERGDEGLKEGIWENYGGNRIGKTPYLKHVFPNNLLYGLDINDFLDDIP